MSTCPPRGRILRRFKLILPTPILQRFTFSRLTHTVLLPLSYHIMLETDTIDQGEVESNVGVARPQVNTIPSQEVNALPVVHGRPSFKRQKETKWELRTEQGCVTMVMHERLFLLPVPPPPLKDMRDNMEWAESAQGNERQRGMSRASDYYEKKVWAMFLQFSYSFHGLTHN